MDFYVLRDFMKRAEVVKRVQVVLADGTRVFADSRAWREFVRLGGQLRVVSPIKLLAATVNPFSPLGGSYEPDEFLAKVGALAAPLPVFDVVLRRSVNTEPRRTTGRRAGDAAVAGQAAKGISEPGEMQLKCN